MYLRDNYKLNIVLTVLITVVFPIVMGIVLTNYFSDKFINIPLHSALEVSGGVIAIAISMIFYIKYFNNQVLTYFNWSTTALLTMGIIDIFHGIVLPGKIFIWLHSIAVFFGGVLFVSIWIKKIHVSNTTYRIFPIAFITFAIVISLASILFPHMIPPMLNEDKTFSFTANMLNIIGGVGFFIASLKFILLYRKNKDFEDLLFVGHTMLFGIAGILFVTSVVWDAQWWLWHCLRLLAYILALYFLYVEFNRDIQLIEKTNKTLAEANKKISSYVELIDANIIISSTDLTGKITSASKAFCEISGYSKEELIGKNHRILKHPEMNESVFKEIWKTISNDQQWEGIIKNKKKSGEEYWVETVIKPEYNLETQKIGYISVRHDITQQKIIEKLSITDALTGLYNRRFFEKQLSKILNSLKRNDEYISYVMMDIDHFKQFNDTYGHQEGDLALQEVAEVLKKTLNRSDDYAFRLGGEEFGIVFKADSKEKAIYFSNKIKQEIENRKIKHMQNSASKYLTVSIGLCYIKANDIDSIDQIYKMTDELLYKAKKLGRNRVISN